MKWIGAAISVSVLIACAENPPAGGRYLGVDELAVPLIEADWRVIKNLRENGDDPECIRPIDHFLYPRSGSEAQRLSLQRAIRELRHGWTTNEASNDGIRAVIQSKTKAGPIAEQIATLTNLGQEYGFEYDGWGTVNKVSC